MLVVKHGVLKDESEFHIRDYDGLENGYQAVTVHPWHRYKGTDYEHHAVFVSVGNYNSDGQEDYTGDGEPAWNIIVDREEFITGLLETFPELKRADDPA